jgi:predicted HTH domain antitoxin
MPLVITDEQLEALKMDEANARVEIACRLFDGERLSLPAAARFAGLGRSAMEGELRRRRIALYRPTVEDVRRDLDVLRNLGGTGGRGS